MKIKIKKLPSSNKLSYGGSTNKLGGDFTNNVTFINEGGTHEQNPFEGVPFGVDNEGTPNLVEEGEVIWNDYVFSNRLTPTKKMLESIGFPEKYKDYSFALIAEELQKESAERPNDLISQRGLQDSMQRLIGLQEEVRNKRKDVQEKKAQKALENTYAEGGNANILNGTNTDQTTDGLPKDEPTISPNNKLREMVSSQAILQKEAERLAKESFDKNVNEYLTKFKVTDDTESSFDWGKLGNGMMRMAPLIANATDLIRNLKKPDYTEGDRVLQAANNAPVSDIKPEVEDVNIRPIDRNYLLNQQLNQGNTMINQIGNQAINAQQAMANMMLANTQTQGAIGDSLMKMDEANLARQMQESEFNRGNDKLITDAAFQNFTNNAQRYNNILDATKYSSEYNTGLDAARAQGISGAVGNMATSLSGVGSENMWREIIDKHPSLAYDSVGNYKTPALEAAALTDGVGKHGGRILDGMTEGNQTLSNTPETRYLTMQEAANINHNNDYAFMHPYTQDGNEVLLYPEELEQVNVTAFKSPQEANVYYGDQFGKKVAKGMGEAGQFIFDYGVEPLGNVIAPLGMGISAAKAIDNFEQGNYVDGISSAINALPGASEIKTGYKYVDKTLEGIDALKKIKQATPILQYKKGGKLLTSNKKRRK